MNYAVVQSEIVKPEPYALEAAFRELAELVDIDAASLSNDAYGIIVDGLSHDHATRLCAALNGQGIRTQVVSEAELPTLTPAKQLRRLDCAGDHLLLYDAIGRTTPVPWEHVVLVAAGFVTMPEFRRIERTRVVMRGTGWQGGTFPILLTDVSSKEESKGRLVLEIYLDIAPVRVAVQAHEFQYTYLAERMEPRYMDSFALLVQDVMAYASTAILNRGAESLGNDETATFHYPSQHAFEEETVWLLWTSLQARRAGTAAGEARNPATKHN
jgi:hypothetical protein